jgi:hypothetical protein
MHYRKPLISWKASSRMNLGFVVVMKKIGSMTSNWLKLLLGSKRLKRRRKM